MQRSSWLVGLALLSACGAPEVQSQRLKDGSWSFTCELSMEECVQRVQVHCPNQRYRIIEGTSETRLRDAPPFERAYHTSRLHLTCTDDGENPLISLGGSKTPAPAGSASAASAPANRVCSAGQTRECIGPGACKGGQACLPSGNGFSNCDCGPSPAPSIATSAPGAEPGLAAPPTAPSGASPATPSSP